MPILYSANLHRPDCLLDYINGNNEIYVENSYYNLTPRKGDEKVFESYEYKENPQPPTIYFNNGGRWVSNFEVDWGTPTEPMVYRIGHPFNAIDEKTKKPLPISTSRAKIVRVSIPLSSNVASPSSVNLVNFTHDMTQVLDLLIYAYGFGINLASETYKAIHDNVSMIKQFTTDIHESLAEKGFSVEFKLGEDALADVANKSTVIYVNATKVRGSLLDTKHIVPVVKVGERLRLFNTIHRIIHLALQKCEDEWYSGYPKRRMEILSAITRSPASANNSAILKHIVTSSNKVYDIYQTNGKFSLTGDLCEDVGRISGLLTKYFDGTSYSIIKSQETLFDIYDKAVNGDVFLKFGFMISSTGERYLTTTVSKYDLTVIQSVNSSDAEAERLATMRRKEQPLIAIADEDDPNNALELSDITSDD